MRVVLILMAVGLCAGCSGSKGVTGFASRAMNGMAQQMRQQTAKANTLAAKQATQANMLAAKNAATNILKASNVKPAQRNTRRTRPNTFSNLTLRKAQR